jgi:hypothetical protein
MPCHPDRVRRNYEDREPLTKAPAYNQTRGDSVLTPCPECAPWRRPSDTNAEQLHRRSIDNGFTANVIEGEQHDDCWGV